MGLHWYDLIGLVVLGLIAFGPKRLPEMGSSLGKTIREFQKSMREVTNPEPPSSVPPSATQTAQPVVAAPEPQAAVIAPAPEAAGVADAVAAADVTEAASVIAAPEATAQATVEAPHAEANVRPLVEEESVH